MKADDYIDATAKRGEHAYTLHASAGAPHALEEHDEDHMHDPSRNAVELAGKPASSSGFVGPGRNAVDAHSYMMDLRYDHLDSGIEMYWTEEEMEIHDQNLKNMVGNCIDAWFNIRTNGNTTRPTEAEQDRATRSIQAKVYQTIQREMEKQKTMRWPSGLLGTYGISSQNGSD